MPLLLQGMAIDNRINLRENSHITELKGGDECVENKKNVFYSKFDWTIIEI